MRTRMVLGAVVLLMLFAGCTKEAAPAETPPEPTWFLSDLQACGADNATLPPCEGTLTDLEVLGPILPQRTWTCLASDAKTDYGFAVYWNVADSRLGVAYRVAAEGAHYPGWVRVQAGSTDQTFSIPGVENRGLVIFPANITASLGDPITVTGLQTSVNYTSNRTELAEATPTVSWLLGANATVNDTARVHVFTGESTYYLGADNVTNTLHEGTDFSLGLNYSPFTYIFETAVEPQPNACGT